MALLVTDFAEGADALPSAEHHGLGDRDREAAIDVGELRQIGDVGGLEAAA